MFLWVGSLRLGRKGWYRRHSPEVGWGDADREVAMTDTAAASRAPVHTSSAVDPSQLTALAEPIAAETGCALYDVQWRGGTLVVLATASEGGAIGVEALTKLSRRLSAALDAADLIDGRYVLEVSSPGLERSLRRPEHFAGAIGERAVIRTSGPLRRRIVGEILEADRSAVSIRIEEISGNAAAEQQIQPGAGQTLSVPFSDIAKARTTFEWGSPPNKGRGRQGR
ncbi:ribosome maturation factor RimP [Candidatus Poriferisodalis sp.]|uniref:ribosome maturation factor RimP n=1 Tax=Candidatus Poriferisodalis sp. TaxID=3101277 RepID=UPI003B59B6FA